MKAKLRVSSTGMFYEFSVYFAFSYENERSTYKPQNIRDIEYALVKSLSRSNQRQSEEGNHTHRHRPLRTATVGEVTKVAMVDMVDIQ